ncbi:MFS transporter [Rothia terrae]|uniref:MFS transporter n=1 Tax=Rothia terrae TaxID=396015 RepID=UPI003404B413
MTSSMNKTPHRYKSVESKTAQRILIALGASVVAVAYGMARFALGLSTPRILDDHIATEAQIGYASSLSFITYVGACFISSWWLKNQKWKLSILAVLASAVVGCLLIAFSAHAVVFILGVGVAGSAAGFASGAIAYRLVRELDPVRESRGQAIANAGTGIGVAVATLILFFVGSWRVVFISAAVLAVIFCLWFCVHQVEQKGNPLDGKSAAEKRGSVSALLVPAVLTILMGAGSSVYWTYGRSLAETQTGLAETQSLLFWGLIGVAGIGGSFSGDAVAKFGTKISWSACSVILGASVLLLPFSTSAVWACVSGVLFGALYTVLCGLTIELGRESWPEAVGGATSILFATIAVGQALGSLIIGFSVALLGLPTLFIAGGVLVLVGAGVVWLKKSRVQG